jgi:hypothetical protein
MHESPYEAEDVLQALLAKFPSCLPATSTPAARSAAGCSSAVRPRCPTTRTRPAAGRSITCSWIRTRCLRSSRSSEAPTRASAGRSSGKCWTMPPTASSTGPWSSCASSLRASASATAAPPMRWSPRLLACRGVVAGEQFGKDQPSAAPREYGYPASVTGGSRTPGARARHECRLALRRSRDGDHETDSNAASMPPPVRLTECL